MMGEKMSNDPVSYPGAEDTTTHRKAEGIHSPSPELYYQEQGLPSRKEVVKERPPTPHNGKETCWDDDGCDRCTPTGGDSVDSTPLRRPAGALPPRQQAAETELEDKVKQLDRNGFFQSRNGGGRATSSSEKRQKKQKKQQGQQQPYGDITGVALDVIIVTPSFNPPAVSGFGEDSDCCDGGNDEKKNIMHEHDDGAGEDRRSTGGDSFAVAAGPDEGNRHRMDEPKADESPMVACSDFVVSFPNPPPPPIAAESNGTVMPSDPLLLSGLFTSLSSASSKGKKRPPSSSSSSKAPWELSVKVLLNGNVIPNLEMSYPQNGKPRRNTKEEIPFCRFVDGDSQKPSTDALRDVTSSGILNEGKNSLRYLLVRRRRRRRQWEEVSGTDQSLRKSDDGNIITSSSSSGAGVCSLGDIEMQEQNNNGIDVKVQSNMGKTTMLQTSERHGPTTPGGTPPPSTQYDYGNDDDDDEEEEVILGSATATLHLWSSSDVVVVSDVDGTVTRSDVRGVLDTIVTERYDYIHRGICKFFTDLSATTSVVVRGGTTAEEARRQRQGGGAKVRFLYLTSRPLSLLSSTRKFIRSLTQVDTTECRPQPTYRLPPGPIFCHTGTLKTVLLTELVTKKTHEFKSDVLKRQVVLPFAVAGKKSDDTLFLAGFGNKMTDAMAYRMAGMDPRDVYLINRESVIVQMTEHNRMEDHPPRGGMSSSKSKTVPKNTSNKKGRRLMRRRSSDVTENVAHTVPKRRGSFDAIREVSESGSGGSDATSSSDLSTELTMVDSGVYYAACCCTDGAAAAAAQQAVMMEDTWLGGDNGGGGQQEERDASDLTSETTTTKKGSGGGGVGRRLRRTTTSSSSSRGGGGGLFGGRTFQGYDDPRLAVAVRDNIV